MSNWWDVCAWGPFDSFADCTLYALNFFPSMIPLLFIGFALNGDHARNSIMYLVMGIGGYADQALNIGLVYAIRSRVDPEALQFQFLTTPYGMPAYASQCLCYYVTMLIIFWVLYHRAPSRTVVLLLYALMLAAMYSRIHHRLNSPADIVVGAAVGTAEAVLTFVALELVLFPALEWLSATWLGAALSFEPHYLPLRREVELPKIEQELRRMARSLGADLPRTAEHMRSLVDHYDTVHAVR